MTKKSLISLFEKISPRELFYMEPWEVILLQAKLYNFYIDKNIYDELKSITVDLLLRCPVQKIEEMIHSYELKVIVSDEKFLSEKLIFSEICCADKEITLYSNTLSCLEMYLKEFTDKYIDMKKIALAHEIAHYLEFIFRGLTGNYFHSEVIADLFAKFVLSLDFYPGAAGLLFLHNKFIIVPKKGI